jgi:hypothetical protein
MRTEDRDKNGAKQRSFYERYKLILAIIGTISGGSLAGIGVKFYNTNEVNQTPARVEILENQFKSYVSSHESEEALKDLLVTQKLAEIKSDLEDLKTDQAKLEDKIDDLTRLVRNGGR